MAIEFRGPAKRIEDLDLPRVGQMIGVGEDEIHAILDVEAAGSGFDSKGRPKMLFEPHIFFRELKDPAKRARAESEGLAYEDWRRGTYPPDSYPRLIAAMKIDETAALKSASWGLGQILGSNHLAAGYATVQDMVTDFTRDEDKHLEAMIRFIKSKKLDDDLRNHEWASFARGYNGALYAAHNYHGKLKAAYERWQRIKDTPYTPGQLPPDVPPIDVPKRPGNPSTGAAAGGAVGGAVVAGGGVIVVKNAIDKGANTTEVAIFVGLALVIAVAVGLIIRHILKRT